MFMGIVYIPIFNDDASHLIVIRFRLLQLQDLCLPLFQCLIQRGNLLFQLNNKLSLVTLCSLSDLLVDQDLQVLVTNIYLILRLVTLSNQFFNLPRKTFSFFLEVLHHHDQTTSIESLTIFILRIGRNSLTCGSHQPQSLSIQVQKVL